MRMGANFRIRTLHTVIVSGYKLLVDLNANKSSRQKLCIGQNLSPLSEKIDDVVQLPLFLQPTEMTCKTP